MTGKAPTVKFRCERDILAEALATAGRAATSRTGALPVLEGLHLSVRGDELAVTGTDLEMSIRLTTTVGGVSDGAVVVPARLSADAVKSLPAGAVEFSSGDDEVTISAGRSQFSLRSYNIDDYPAQVDPAAEAVTLSSSAFADALRQVVRAASTDEARGVITGVLIAAEDDSVRMVATDSYRLAVRDLPETSILAGGQKVLVPHRALTELQRILGSSTELTVRLGARHATFECGHSRLTTRLIEGEYPNYRNLVPASSPNMLTVGKEALLESLRRVKIMAQRDTSSAVRLNLGGDTMTLSVRDQDYGTVVEELDVKYEGDEMLVGFNPDYLMSGVDAIDADEVTLSLRDPVKAVVLRGVGKEDYLYLLMPLRVSSIE
jgi:DNA polymerase-3 subunit beta